MYQLCLFHICSQYGHYCFRYNIQYGRISASNDDIVAAAEHADIHERILTFPDGYETKVCFILSYTLDYPDQGGPSLGPRMVFLPTQGPGCPFWH
jgi:hypothetical protein